MLKTAGFTLVAILLGSGVAAAQDLTLEQLLAKHYAAIGGLNNWKALQSVRATGRMSFAPGTEAPFTMVIKRPAKARLEFTLQGMTGVQALDGTTAWMIMPFMGKTEPEEMPPEMAKDLVEMGDIDGPLVDYVADGHQLELVGKTEVEGTPAYHLKVTLKNGDVQHYFFDAEYFVPIKVEGTRMVQGNAVDFEQTLSDYKEVGGLMMAHAIEVRPKGAPAGQAFTLDTIELNVPVDDAVFVMPKPAK